MEQAGNITPKQILKQEIISTIAKNYYCNKALDNLLKAINIIDKNIQTKAPKAIKNSNT